MENDRFVISHVLYRLLYMRKSPITRIRTYILNIYACGNWKARKSARTFSISMHAEIGNHAKPHVDSLQLYIRKALNQLSRTYDSLLGWRIIQTIQPITDHWSFCPWYLRKRGDRESGEGMTAENKREYPRRERTEGKTAESMRSYPSVGKSGKSVVANYWRMC